MKYLAKIRIKLNNSSSNRTANSSNGSINTSRYDRFDLKKLISDSLNKSKTWSEKISFL